MRLRMWRCMLVVVSEAVQSYERWLKVWSKEVLRVTFSPSLVPTRMDHAS